ncbi:MAG TPA: hypothetical protein VNI36_10385 [Candidatus Dormibacteraeota bacterium]|nr:hypothetical protein [Candidatus Dormibacteraeota bacterium]
MLWLASMMATAALLLSADVSGVIRTRPPSEPAKIPLGETLPVLPEMSPAGGQTQSARNDAPGKPNPPGKLVSKPLQPMSRLALVRYVDGEFVQVLEAIPAGKKGFHLKAGAPLDENHLRMAVGSSGAAINPGDKAQITALEFKDHQIIIDINGGGRGKKRLRDRIHLEIGGLPTMTTTSATSVPDKPMDTNVGATVYLDFDKPLPDMTPDELKAYLSPLFDFSNEHSAAVQWVDTLPPDIQNAIRDKQPVVGMDHDMVLAAMGRPDRKVREREPDGNEEEDWIYGHPPSKTIFVKFEGDKVTQVEQFPK